jgi:hypothetical protein
MSTTYTVLSSSATVFDRDGYRQREGVKVCDFGDTISIGSTVHNKSDLVSTETTITSIHGWEVEL